jgi:hypothetical protein
MEALRALDPHIRSAGTNQLALKPLIDIGPAISNTPLPNETNERRPLVLTAPAFKGAC